MTLPPICSGKHPPVVPCLDVWPADKHVAAVVLGKARQTPCWEFSHGDKRYTSAPGPTWRRATPEDWT